jgi:hypothetical protein
MRMSRLRSIGPDIAKPGFPNLPSQPLDWVAMTWQARLEVGEVVELLRRCAWCLRTWSAEGCQKSTPEKDANRETSTICPDCVQDLIRLGQSANA